MICSQKRKALVLDDEAPFLRLFILMMTKLDWECEVTSSAQEALELLKSRHFDALITDYHLGRENGFHFICCLRRDGIKVPAIVMSGDPHILELTPKDLLTIPAVLLKPFTLSKLKEALENIQGW